MKEDILISVIVPVYKVEHYLRKCVDSIRNQTYRNLEILLVDDGSPDSCGEICDAFAREDSRITVIHKENGGLSSARNAGLEVFRGEYVAFVDSDDWIEADAYENMLALALEAQAEMVCAGRYDVSESSGSQTLGLCPPKRETVSAEEMLRRLLLWDNCDSAAWDKLYHRSLFAGIRYPQGMHYEDVPVTYRLIERAGRVAMLDQPIYHYLHRQNSITTAPLTARSFQLEEHTDIICPYIAEKYPALRDPARYYRVCALRFSVLLGDLAPEESRRQFASRLKESRKQLRSHLGFILRSPLFGKDSHFGAHEKPRLLLASLGLYRQLHRLRCRGK